MFVGPANLLFTATYGVSRPSKIETGIYQTLSARLTGIFDPRAVRPPVSSLLDLSSVEPSGLSMFDVLAQAHGLQFAAADLLAAYLKDR